MAQFGSGRRMECSARLADRRDEGDVDRVRAKFLPAGEPHLGRPEVLGECGVAQRTAAAGHARPGPSLGRSAMRTLG